MNKVYAKFIDWIDEGWIENHRFRKSRQFYSDFKPDYEEQESQEKKSEITHKNC